VSPDTVGARRWNRGRWALVALVLLGWALRLPPILDNRFHADEALYAYWGLLIGRGQDLWLATVPVDKPPLMPYLVAGAQALFGNSEFAVRLPGLAAGLVTIPLVAALSNVLYDDTWVTASAAAGVALSPFATLFSATAFTDPVMVALGLGTCLAAARGRPGRAGLLAGLAFAAKQTGLVWVPLAAAMNMIRDCRLQIGKLQIGKSQTYDRQHLASVVHRLLFPLCFLVVVGIAFAWDLARGAQGAESFWCAGVTAYGSLRLIWPQELWARLEDWVELARYLFVSPAVNGILLAGLPVLVWRATRHQRHAQGALTDLLLGSFALMYLLFHWLWAFPVWDRYLLPLAPVLAILLGRILALSASYLQLIATYLAWVIRHSSFVIRRSSQAIGHWSLIIAHCSLVIFLATPAWNAAHSRYPIGGDHGAYDGIDEVAAFLRNQPEGTVVYQHWLGWHYAHYVFDAPLYLAYWPSPAWLAQDVQAFGAKGARYITFPSWESRARVEQALDSAGYVLAPAFSTTRRDGTRSFTVYQIRPLSNR